MEHKKIVSENGTVHYWIEKGIKNSSKCIVFTHGVTANHTMFEKQVEFFRGTYTLILWDVPMHGLSRPYSEFSYYRTAVELYQILKSESVRKVVLVGMSMGGYPSQHFAVLYPDMVEGFIALDTTPLGLSYYSKTDLFWLRQVAPMAKLFSEKLLKISMAKSVSKSKYSYEKMMSMLEPLTKADIIEQMRIAYEYVTKENLDADFLFPVLILVGENDSTGKVKTYCKQWSKKTGYPIHMIKGAKHFSNGDNPEQVNYEIQKFVEQL